jgi:hypothetical protein
MEHMEGKVPAPLRQQSSHTKSAQQIIRDDVAHGTRRAAELQ